MREFPSVMFALGGVPQEVTNRLNHLLGQLTVAAAVTRGVDWVGLETLLHQLANNSGDPLMRDLALEAASVASAMAVVAVQVGKWHDKVNDAELVLRDRMRQQVIQAQQAGFPKPEGTKFDN